MARFSTQQLLRAHRFVLAIHEESDVEALRTMIPAGIDRLVQSDRPNFNELHRGPHRTSIIPAPVPAYWPKLGPVILSHMHEHPLLHQSVRLFRSVCFTDQMDYSVWRRCALYQEYYIPAGARYQMGVKLHERGDTQTLIGLNRSRRDFSSEERRLIEWISPHIASAWRNAWKNRDLREQNASADGRQSMLVTDWRTGRVATVAAPAAALLQRYCSKRVDDGDLLPDDLQRWLKHQCTVRRSADALTEAAAPFHVARDGSQLSLRLLQCGPATAVVLLNESRLFPASAPAPRLTRREHQILHWIGEGKRNREIATILELSPRTVDKHVEHIFAKLGVETRTAAARYALERRSASDA